MGKPEAAALGLEHALLIPPVDLNQRLSRGVDGIRDEVAASGDEEALECLEYVLHAPAGSSAKLFGNSPCTPPVVEARPLACVGC